jgi:hypothetical protein
MILNPPIESNPALYGGPLTFKLARVLVLLLLCVVLSPPAVLAQDPAAMETFYQGQTATFLRELHDPSLNSRIRNIWFKLARYSNRMYPVLPAQNFTAGQSLPNGVILLDVSAAGDDHVEVAAFWLAHEWGHQVLGHTYLQLTPIGRYIAATSGTAQEDAADRYGARFLKASAYPVEPVLEMLCSIPSVPADSHSDGPTRARNVASAYGSPVADPCSPPTPDASTYNARVRIWSKYQGNPTRMEVSIDGNSAGTISNLQTTETLDLGDLTEGRHSYSLSNITVYGPQGILASGLECSGTFTIHADTRFQMEARLLPSGEVVCRWTR